MSYEDDAKAYLTEHSIDVGTTVKVMRKPTAEETKVKDVWVERCMDPTINNAYTLDEIDDGLLYLSNGFWYPYFVIGKVE